jgi:hypothetical protein
MYGLFPELFEPLDKPSSDFLHHYPAITVTLLVTQPQTHHRSNKHTTLRVQRVFGLDEVRVAGPLAPAGQQPAGGAAHVGRKSPERHPAGASRLALRRSENSRDLSRVSTRCHETRDRSPDYFRRLVLPGWKSNVCEARRCDGGESIDKFFKAFSGGILGEGVSKCKFMEYEFE